MHASLWVAVTAMALGAFAVATSTSYAQTPTPTPSSTPTSLPVGEIAGRIITEGPAPAYSLQLVVVSVLEPQPLSFATAADARVVTNNRRYSSKNPGDSTFRRFDGGCWADGCGDSKYCAADRDGTAAHWPTTSRDDARDSNCSSGFRWGSWFNSVLGRD